MARLTCGKSRLCLADHIIREYDIDDIILALQARAGGKILRSSIANALWHWMSRVREHLDCRTPIPSDLFEEFETRLHRGFVLYLVQKNAEYCAVFDGLSAPLSLNCSLRLKPDAAQISEGLREARLTRKHGMSSVANQNKRILAPRRNWVSSNQFPELDVSGFSERCKLTFYGSSLLRS